MSLTCQVKVVLNKISKERAETVKKALEPDNVKFPEGLSLHIENSDNKLIFSFESKKNMNHMIGTIDEVLEHIQMALKVIE
ncbi:MAG: KEOPS complex subunit Pcc1 [Nitrosopumilus sp.]